MTFFGHVAIPDSRFTSANSSGYDTLLENSANSDRIYSAEHANRSQKALRTASLADMFAQNENRQERGRRPTSFHINSPVYCTVFPFHLLPTPHDAQFIIADVPTCV